MQSMLSSILRQGNPLSDLNKGLKLYLDGTYDAVNGWFVDKSGHGNHGVPYNGVTTGTGVVGDGMSFDGVDDYLDCGNDSSLQIINDFTIVGQIKISSYDDVYKAILTHRKSTTNAVLGIWEKNGYLYIEVKNDDRSYNISYTSSSNRIPLNTWTMIGFQLNSNSVNLIVGETILTGVRTSGGTFLNYDLSLYIGKHLNGQYFNGTLDEIRIYNRALSPNEVKALYRLKRV